MRVVVLIPAYNEEEHIAETLSAVDSLVSVSEIVVVDDGSTDSTYSVASNCHLECKLSVLRMERNSGKGGALNYGRQKVAGDVYLLLDADLGSTARLAHDLLQPVLRDEADMTVAQFGSQQSASGTKMGFGVARFLASMGVRFLTGKKVTSPLSGQRAIKVEVLEQVGEFAPGFGVEVALTVGALHHGFRVLEIPVAMKHRALGRGLRGMRHRGRQLVQVLLALRHCWKKEWHR